MSLAIYFFEDEVVDCVKQQTLRLKPPISKQPPRTKTPKLTGLISSNSSNIHYHHSLHPHHIPRLSNTSACKHPPSTLMNRLTPAIPSMRLTHRPLPQRIQNIHLHLLYIPLELLIVIRIPRLPPTIVPQPEAHDEGRHWDGDDEVDP